MKSLDEFPEEILAQIIAGKQHSFLVVQLWKSGSRNLSKKLANAVRSVDLCDDAPFSTSRWPKCLSSLTKLQHLSISLPYGCLLPTCADIQKEILALPSTLESFELNSMDCSFASDVPCPGMPLKTSQDGSPIIEPFASLRRLTLGLATAFSPQSPFYHLVTRHIKELTLPHYNVHRYSDGTLAMLPPKLEVLKTELLFGDCSQTMFPTLFSKCPPSLTRVQCIDIGDNADVMNLIPKRLQIGELKYNDILWEQQFAESCPPGIEKMDITEIDYDCYDSMDNHWAKLLPPRLTSLTISDSAILNDHLIALLPSTITDLSGDLTFQGHQDYESMVEPKKLYLPNLKTFNLFGGTRYHPNTLRCLPEKVKTLSIRLDYTVPIEHFPPVTSLSLYGKNFVSLAAPFPNTITKLSLSTLGGGGVLHPSKFSLLPASLLSLELSWFDDNIEPFDEEQVILPPKLQSFLVDRWSILWFSKLPRSLLDLSVELVDGFSDLIVDPNVDYFADLPLGLRRLMLGRNVHHNTAPLPGCSLSQLHDLEYLNLYGFSEMDSSVLKTIFHGMKKLRELKLAMTTIRPEDAPFLPPKARKCVFRDFANPSKEVIQNWPESATIWIQDVVSEALAGRIKQFKERALLAPDPRVIIH